jgi:Tfp pilus tip-associated adhesin PilY1
MKLTWRIYVAILVLLAQVGPTFGAIIDTSANSQAHIQTQCDPATWSGDVVLRSVGSNNITEADWQLSERLAAQDAVSRNIYTINGQTGTALSFERNNYASLSAIQQADMEALNTVEGDQAQQAGDLIDYLRGDMSEDGNRYRDRQGGLLGDIIHSLPAVVTAPGENPLGRGIAGAAQYPSFAANNASRDAVIYVGANDGMLHAIDQHSGSELFAFIPHGVFAAPGIGAGLHQLAKHDYVHRRYVDASPMAHEAYVNLDGSGKRWRTLLAGGLGAGGRSVYLLDVTDPNSFGTPANVVKWEFTHENLGYTFSDVQITRLGDGKWYAIFGNGYNANGGDGKAKLFLVNLENSSDYFEIDTGVGHANGSSCEEVGSDCNGLSSPELADLNGDGIVDWVYAGDLHGNVWAFDLPDAGGALDISATRLFTSCAVPLESGQSCTVDNRQPITTKVALARNPYFTGSVDEPNINVYWGTGQLLAKEDVGDKTLQSFYSVLHTGNESGSASPAYHHDDLFKRSYVARDGAVGLADARSVKPGAEVNYKGVGGSRQYGWYIELSDSGERLVNRPVIVGDVVAFNTTVPQAGNPCDMDSSSWINALSLAHGLAPDRNPNNDTDKVGDEQVFDYNKDGSFGADDMVGGENGSEGNVVLSIRVPGEPTSPNFIGDTQYVGLANSGDDNDGVEALQMQLSDGGVAGRAGWYQVR